MTRKLYPAERMQLGVPRLAGRPAVSLAGTWRTVYLPSGDLADIQFPLGGAVPGSRLQLDDLSRLPEFLGPDNYEEILYDDNGTQLYPAEGRQGEPGVPGEQGPPGLPGNAVSLSAHAYFAQVPGPVLVGGRPTYTYVVNHNLGFTPSGILATPNGGQPTDSFEIVSNGDTQTIIRTDVPFVGYVDLS